MSENEQMTAARVRQETRTLLGEEAGNLDYITDELVAGDAMRTDPPEVSGGETLGDVCYGTNPRWGKVRLNGISHSVILFNCGDDPSDPDGACESRKTGWLMPNDWKQHLLGSCRGNLRQRRYRFSRKDRL